MMLSTCLQQPAVIGWNFRPIVFGLVLSGVLGIVGCTPEALEPVQSVAWYKAHEAERVAMATKCHNNPGQNDLRYMIDTVSFYRQLYGTVAGFTGNFHDMAWYRNAQCFKEPGCSPSQWGLILENEVIGAQSQKKSIEALFRGLERQYDTLNLDSRRLKRLQLAAQTSNGQAEVLQHNNMLTSEGANQLMQIRAALLAQQNMEATRQQAQADREAMQMAADRNARQGTFQPSPRHAW